MTKNMTEGKPLPLILSFFLPLFAGNLLQQFYNVVDGVIVSKGVGLEAFAALGSTNALNFLLIGFTTGICCGFGIPVAQSFGAQDMSEMRHRIVHAFYWTAILSVLLTLISTQTREILLLMQTPTEILDGASAYIGTIFNGISTIMFYNLAAAILRSVGDSRSPIVFLSIAIVLNIFLDLIFVFPLQMGVKGAAVATVIAQGLSGIASIIYLFCRYPFLRPKKEEFRFSWKTSRRVLFVGLPMGFQASISAFGAIILQRCVNPLGTQIIASISASTRVKQLFFLPMETLGISISTFAGQNFGAKKIDRIRQGVRQADIVVEIYAVTAFLLLFFFGKYFARLFIDTDEVQALNDAAFFLRCNGMFFPPLGLLFIHRYALQGIGKATSTVIAGVMELIARSVGGLIFIPIYGFHAACFSDPSAWAAAAITVLILYWYYMKKLDKTKKNGH